MTSEEQYLDDLLKNVTQNSSERSMDEVMREMMGVSASAPEPMQEVKEENLGPALEQPSEEDLAAMLESLDFDALDSELKNADITPSDNADETITSFQNDTLADVMDVLEDPSIFTDPSMANNPDVDLLGDISKFIIDSPSEETPETEEMPVIEDIIPEAEEMPVIEDIIPETEEMSVIEDIPEAEEMPVIEDIIPEAEEMPVIEDIIPENEEMPVIEDIPDVDEIPAIEDIPETEEVPAFEEVPGVEDITSTDDISINEDANLDNINIDDINIDDINLDNIELDNLNLDDFNFEESSKQESEESIEEQPFVEPEGIIFESDEEPSSDDSISELDDMLAELGIDDDTEKSEDETVDSTISDLNFDQPSLDDLDALFNGIEMEAMGMNAPESSDNEVTESETSNIVDKLESTENSDDDLLALLEGIDENASEDDYKDIKSEFDVEDNQDEISALLGEDEEDSSRKKKSKKKKEKVKKEKAPKEKKGGFSLFKKKNKDDEALDSENTEEEPKDSVSLEEDSSLVDAEDALNLDKLISEASAEENSDADSLENIAESLESVEIDEELANLPDKSKKEKKPGLLARILAFLTEEVDEEEETPASEITNEDIIAEIDAESAEALLEDKGKKKGKKEKKEKKEKKSKKDSKKEGASEDGEEGAEGAPKKEKKTKKEKAPKEPKEKLPRKVVLSKKASICLVGLCATVIAALVILSTVLPDSKEKTLARRAYLNGDYETAYENLYGKNLNSSDAIIFNRSKDILMIERRWNSYESRIKLNQPAEAIDSLIEGIVVYDTIKGRIDSDVHGIIDGTYQKIIIELNNKYNISVDEAKRLYSLDSTEYTKALYSIAYGEQYNINQNEGDTNSDELSNDDAIGQDTDTNDVDEPEKNLDDLLPEEEDLL
ncbi:MAG: hypothetical protein MJZ11_00015 [Lachnospiraceae bacterium]|nr:hypothetical protein [Lachnospiraceae bacterium]